MRLCCELSAHDQIKVAVKNSTKGAVAAGGAALVGGLLAGPPGIAVGQKNLYYYYLHTNHSGLLVFYNYSKLQETGGTVSLSTFSFHKRVHPVF